MSGTAQQEEIFGEMDYAATGTESTAALKQAVSERLAAHRSRRARSQAPVAEVEAGAASRRAGASRIREAVAARYKNSVTYREFLAAEAERALEQANAEAEVAVRKAQAAAEVQMQLLEELREWEQPKAVIAPAGLPPAGDLSAGLTVRLYEDLSAVRPPIEGARRVVAPIDADEHETRALDAEIAFRRAPEFDHHVAEPIAISGNLIEFPRQLVAARKARPRLAEGPLRQESESEPQLRIFEVEPEQISAAPAERACAPEWQSILLEGARRPEPAVHVEARAFDGLPLPTAPLELRLMAAVVDVCCVGAGLACFVAVVAEIAGARLHAMPLPLVGISAGAVAGTLFVLFQLLFFTLGEATPGMRYARIALCTFGDDSPTRSAMRGRVLATLLAACPLGLGLAWALLDEEGLGWHDRIAKMYQRAY